MFTHSIFSGGRHVRRNFITAAFAAALLLPGYILSGQTCTTAWPYLYPDFQEGTVYLDGGIRQHYKLNVHLLRTTLHYVEHGMIKEAYPRDIDSVRIGKDLFRYVNGVPMRVAADGPSGYVAEMLRGDFTSAVEGSGAYGMSASTISKTDLSSLEVSGGTNQNHMLLLQNKEHGKTVRIVGEYFIVTGSGVYPAVRSDIQKILPEERIPEFKAFVKERRIKWKDSGSLLELTTFL